MKRMVSCSTNGLRPQWKVGVVETAAALFRKRAERAKPDGLERIVQMVPDARVEPENVIPPDPWSAATR